MTRLALVLGDQLNLNNPALLAINKGSDSVLLAEVLQESTHVWSHKARIALFLSSMRHFHIALDTAGYTTRYVKIDEKVSSLHQAIIQQVRQNPAIHSLFVSQPGDWRVLQNIKACCKELALELNVLEDSHFLCGLDEFKQWASGRKELRMEYFYREMRKKHHVLLENIEDKTPQPLGGQWNFDADNRQSFPKSGPSLLAGNSTPSSCGAREFY
jgi:deoxyribodipyrimidine photolyase-related protein